MSLLWEYLLAFHIPSPFVITRAIQKINCKHAWAGWIFLAICRLITSVVEFQDMLQWLGEAFYGYKRKMACITKKNFLRSLKWALDLLFIQRSTHLTNRSIIYFGEYNPFEHEINIFRKFPFSHCIGWALSVWNWSWIFFSWKLHETIMLNSKGSDI